MLTNVYSIFPHLPDLDGIKYLTEAQSSNFIQPFEMTSMPFVSRSSFEDTKFIKDLTNYFGHARAYYLKTDPHTCYDWHRDLKRHTTINFLLNDVKDSFTLFKDDSDNKYKEIVKIPYELYRPTVLKSTIRHGVFNYSDQIRYVLSVGFDLTVSYDQLCDFLNNYQASSY